jgi:hypothetical protein
MGKKASHSEMPPPAPKKGGWKGRTYGLAEKFELVVNAVAAPLPSPRIKLWLAGFFHPVETYENVEARANIAGIAANLLIFYFAYSLVFFLFMLALTSLLPADELQSMGIQKSPDLAQVALGSLVIGPVASVISAFIAFALVFLPARAFGGRGTFAKQANSMALVLCGSNALLLAFMCVVFVIFLPSFILRDSLMLGATASIAAMLASIPIFLLCLAILLYAIYAYFLVIRKAHGLSSLRAAGAALIAAALIVLLDAAIAALMKG